MDHYCNGHKISLTARGSVTYFKVITQMTLDWLLQTWVLLGSMDSVHTIFHF